MTQFYGWDDIRADLHDGDEATNAAERALTEAWISTFDLAEETQAPGPYGPPLSQLAEGRAACSLE